MKGDDFGKDAETEVEIFKECQARLQIAESSESENRIAAIEDLKFENGDQWPADITNARKIDNRPSLTINHTRSFVRRVVNNIKQQRPRIKVHPTGGGARVEDAQVVNGLIRHIETLSKASVAYDMGAESAVKIGWGYWRILAEYIDPKSFEQELKIFPIRNPFTVYFDPAAQMPDGSDATWCIISEKLKRTEYKSLYPRAENADWQGGAPGDSSIDWESKEDIRLAEYFRIRLKPETLYKMVNGDSVFESDLPPENARAISGYQIALDAEGNKISRRTSRRTVEWFRLNGSKLVDRRELPGEWLPVVRVEGNVLDINGKVDRRGMVRDLKDPARMFNYWRTAETEVVALSPKAPWVVAEGQIEGHPEWHSANQKSYSALVYKPVVGEDGQPVPPPQRQAPAQIPAAQVNAAQGAEHDLMAVAGMPHEPGQDTAGQVVSGKAIQRRQSISDLSHYQYYDNQTLSIAHTGRILLDLIPYYYDTERMQRIIGDDGVPQMVTINQKVIDPQTQAILSVKNDLKMGRYDVVMDTGPGYQTKREEGAEALLGLLQTPLGETVAKTGADLVVRSIDAPYMEELADRLVATNPAGMQKVMEGLPKQAQAIVGSLQMQLQQSQEVIKGLQLELKYKTSIELGWMQTEKDKANLSAKTKVHDTEVRSVTSRDVAEIQAAASLLNTHAEAAHNERAADKMIEAGARTGEH